MHKIKIIIFISLCSFLLISCATTRNDCPLLGKWQSNEKATLEEMEKHGGDIPEKLKKMLSDKFFGQLTLEYTCSTMTSYFKDSPTAKDMKYEIIRRESNLLEVRYHAPELLGGITTKRINIIGDCYYVPTAGFTFSEVFCKVK